MTHRKRRLAAFCLMAVCMTALLGCGDPEVLTPKSWLQLPVRLEVGTKIQFRVEIEQQLSHGTEATSTVKSEILLGLHVAKREGGALLVEVTRTDDGEGKDFQFHILPNHKFSRIKGFEFPSAISATVGEYSIKHLTRPHFWLHDMLRPFLRSRFKKGETWNLSPVFDGVPFPIPMELVARITTVDEERITIETEGDVSWTTMDAGAPELVAWPRKSLRTHSGKAVVSRRDGLVESLEWTLELTNDRDWTFADGSFPEPDGQQHTIRHAIRVTRL